MKRQFKTKNCAVCGASFVQKWLAATCSDDCREIYKKTLEKRRNARKAERRRAHRAEHPLDFARHRERMCDACGGPFKSNNVATRCCSFACGRKMATLTRRARALVSIAPKPCAECGKEFTPRPGGAVYAGKSRPPRFCCRACAHDAQRRPKPAAGTSP